MRFFYTGLLTIFCVMVLTLSNHAQNVAKLEIIHPKNNSTINASTVYFTGNTEPDAVLTINGKPAKVSPKGAFSEVISLNRGTNNIILKTSSAQGQNEIMYTINVPAYETTIPAYPIKIDTASVYPQKNILFRAGDAINVSFKGSTGLKASFSIGDKVKNIPMVEQIPKNTYSQPEFGKQNQVSSVPVKGYYKGFYKIQYDDNFSNEQIKIQLTSPKQKLSSIAKGKLSTIPYNSPPLIGEVTTDYAVTRTAPDQSRLTPLPFGTLLSLTGKIGDVYRFKYSNSLSGWISEKDIQILPPQSMWAESTVRLLSVDSNADDIYIKIPLTQKLPFIIEQTSENQMNLRLFGAKMDVDLFSYDGAEDFIKELKWIQESDDCLKLNISANSKQFWGYSYYYNGNTLVLKLRKAPKVDTFAPLQNKIICIDAGHGGTEPGAIGLTGVPEKTINLGIARELKTILEFKGARVIMTRNSDETTEIFSRVKTANANNSQVIISIHNNSLPSSRNPLEEHGTSVYYYHSQSLPLAKFLHQSLLDMTGFKDFGVFYDSLVMTRPTEAPSVLLEVGFMINPDEYNQLITPEFQEKAAYGIAQGLENFFLIQTQE
jgi:N-acetylmuramoyl-L-alanine amidase